MTILEHGFATRKPNFPSIETLTLSFPGLSDPSILRACPSPKTFIVHSMSERRKTNLAAVAESFGISRVEIWNLDSSLWKAPYLKGEIMSEESKRVVRFMRVMCIQRYSLPSRMFRRCAFQRIWTISSPA